MKKLLVIAVALASVNAFATRARVNALGNSSHLIDTETVYSNPADMFFLGGDYAVIESGTGASADGTAAIPRDGQTNAEGMVVRSWGDMKAGLSLGHMSDLATKQRKAAVAFNAAIPGSFLTLPAGAHFLQQNPVELTWGMKAGDAAYAGTLVYSKFESKSGNNEKENTVGLRGGFRMGAMNAKLGLGLANTYQYDTATATAGNKFTGTLGINAGFGYWLDTTYLAVNLTSAGFKVENATVETGKVTHLDYRLDAIDSMKKDGSEFFYGAGIMSSNDKITIGTTDATSDMLSIPITLGMEVEANSWLVLRGSVSQAVPLLNSSKSTSTTPPASSVTVYDLNPDGNNTMFAAGAGLKFNKLTLDGTILAKGSQTIDSSNLLGQVGLAYMF